MKYICYIGLASLLASCSAQQYSKQADAEVYTILKKAEKHVFKKRSNFTIKTPRSNRKPSEVEAIEILKRSQSGGTVTLSIDNAINYATRNSREYQTQKERLYIAALNLTDARHNFSPNFSSSVNPTVARGSNGEQTGNASIHNGARQALLAGGSYSVNLANDLLRFFTGDPRRSASSVISINLLKPLLRGAGKKIAAERLTQANRNVIYALRDYNQFQHEFSRGIVIQYLRLLQQKESVKNQYANYLSRKANTDYLRARAVDRASPQEVSDSEQGELQAKNNWINATARYQTSLDNYKITLGMPTTAKLNLVDSELEKIESAGLLSLHLSRQNAFRLALKNRLSLLNEIDRFEDQKRQVAIAANQLKADINLTSSASLRSSGTTNYERFNFDQVSADVGLQINLPVNRKTERNSYRRSLIQFQSSIRSLSRQFDSLENLIQRRLRELQQFKQSYEIQKGAVALAEKRVDANKMRLQAGTLIFRRLSESQDALINAQNAATNALVDYQEARLQFYTDIGILDTEKRQYWLKRNPIKR